MVFNLQNSSSSSASADLNFSRRISGDFMTAQSDAVSECLFLRLAYLSPNNLQSPLVARCVASTCGKLAPRSRIELGCGRVAERFMAGLF